MKNLSDILLEVNNLPPLTKVMCAASNYLRKDLEGLSSSEYGALIQQLKSSCKSLKQMTEYTNVAELFEVKKGAIKIVQSSGEKRISDVYIWVKEYEIHLCMSFAYCQDKPIMSAKWCKFYPGHDDVWIAKETDLIKLIKSIEVPYGKTLFAQHDDLIADVKAKLGITMKKIEVS